MEISKNELLKNLELNKQSIKEAVKNSGLEIDKKVEIPTKNQIKDFSIKTLLDSLFKDLSTNAKSKNEILNILKQSDITLNIKNTLGDLKASIELLKNDKILHKSTQFLDKLLLHVKDLDAKGLKGQIEKSGLFLESKLSKLQTDIKSSITNKQAQTRVKEVILNDMKAALLHIKQELSSSSHAGAKDTLVQVDKVLTQIHYYQLLSLSSNANILYLPLLWDGLQEGQVSIKKLKQNRFFCEINLKLKEFGKIDLLVMLFDDTFINISVFAQNYNFLKLAKENLQELKKGINNVGLVPSNVYLYDSLKDEKIKKETKAFVDKQQLGKGINIHV